MESHLLRERDEIADIAAAASLAVVRIARHLVRTARELQAVRRHDEQPIRGDADVHPVKQEIAHRDERALQAPPLDAKDGAEPHGGGEKEVDQLVRLPLHPRHIGQPRDREHHVEDPKEGHQNRNRKERPEPPRQHRLNPREPRHTDVPYGKEERRREQCHEREHPDEKPFFRTGRQHDRLFHPARRAVDR